MKTSATKLFLLSGLLALGAVAPVSANPALNGRWQMDPNRSSSLDGWTKMDLVIAQDGSEVSITHEMQWRSTKYRATNVVDTAREVDSDKFFRIEQRHMAVYPTKGGVTHTAAEWIDDSRTLRTESRTPVEVSQGDVVMRITSEYRIGEDGQTLTWIELHSTRPRPLVYIFRKVQEEDTK